MAPILHPQTGVVLNPILKRRKWLSQIEAQTARLMRDDDHMPIHEVAQMLGIHPYRVSQAIREARVSDAQLLLF